MSKGPGADLLRERLRAERDERRRLAELLHDGPVQHVAALVQMSSALVAALEAGDHPAARAVAFRAEQVAREAATELRDVVSGIDPAALERDGFAAAVQQLAARTSERTGVCVSVDATSGSGLGEGAQSGLYQVIREAIDQAVRRGPPGEILVAVRVTDAGGVELEVADDGAAERRQAVLDGLAERAAELNATLSVTRAEDRTSLRLVLPPSAARL